MRLLKIKLLIRKRKMGRYVESRDEWVVRKGKYYRGEKLAVREREEDIKHSLNTGTRFLIFLYHL